jgi:hypothetical protein
VQKNQSKKNIIIQDTSNIVAFKDNKQRLQHPAAGFRPQSIETETHFLELAQTLEMSGHLIGKKHEPQPHFPHCDIFVLPVEESSHYKHLNARWERKR